MAISQQDKNQEITSGNKDFGSMRKTPERDQQPSKNNLNTPTRKDVNKSQQDLELNRSAQVNKTKQNDKEIR